MVLVYLDSWEWDCCGTPFRAGDRVELQVHPATPRLRDLLAPAGSGIDLAESHHEIDPDDEPTRMLTGTVRRIDGLALDHDTRREPRTPRPRPSLSWTTDAGEVVLAMAGDDRPFTIVSTPIPGTGRSVPVRRVPAAARFGEELGASGGAEKPGTPGETETPAATEAPAALEGYLVEIDEDPPDDPH